MNQRRNFSMLHVSPIKRVLVSVLFGCMACQGRVATSTHAPEDLEKKGSAETKAAPTVGVELFDLSGQPKTLVADASHELFVLAFWATWCDPCSAEVGQLETVYRQYESRGMRFFAVAIDGPSTESKIEETVRGHGWNFPVLHDKDAQVLRSYNPSAALPFYVVLDAHGAVLRTHQGYVQGDEVELAKFMDAELPGG